MSEGPFTVKDVPSTLARQTLLDRDLVRVVDRPSIRVLPWLDVVVLGGRSICDRGGDVLLNVVAELRAAMASHRILALTGPGIRARHVLGVGLDLGMPTGVLAGLASGEAAVNGHMVAALLAADGVSFLSHTTAAHQLATHLAACPLAVSNGYPPFGHYEMPPALGKLPPHGADAGALLLADSYGANRVIYCKDVDGVGSADPAAGGEVSYWDRIDVATLRSAGPATLPIETSVLDLLGRTRHVREVRVVNGTVPGTLTRALAGEQVGTLVTA
ncbi:MAG: amino acid kinase family protein [Sporichthyaceae bacterium]